MRSALTRQLKKEFEAKLLQRMPSAKRVAMDDNLFGWLAWSVIPNERVGMYVTLIISPKADQFTLELAWSTNNRIPKHTGKWRDSDQGVEELRFRISRLWQMTGFEVWYDLQHEADFPDSGPPFSSSVPIEECFSRIPIKVDRALDALEAYGVPYFSEISQTWSG